MFCALKYIFVYKLESYLVFATIALLVRLSYVTGGLGVSAQKAVTQKGYVPKNVRLAALLQEKDTFLPKGADPSKYKPDYFINPWGNTLNRFQFFLWHKNCTYWPCHGDDVCVRPGDDEGRYFWPQGCLPKYLVCFDGRVCVKFLFFFLLWWGVFCFECFSIFYHFFYPIYTYFFSLVPLHMNRNVENVNHVPSVPQPFNLYQKQQQRWPLLRKLLLPHPDRFPLHQLLVYLAHR